MSRPSLLSGAFGAGVALRGALYERDVLPVYRLPVPVVSVGNIAVGGRGKSPLAMHIADWFVARGMRTALLLRGYRGRMERTGGWVSKGEGPLVSAREAGDEAWQAAILCNGVLVRVGADRVVQGRGAVAEGAEVIVLDDGFQHRRVYRDLDIVCLDPADISAHANLLPAGHLRERPAALSRAHLQVGFTDAWEGHPSPPPVQVSTRSTSLLCANNEQCPLSRLPGRVHLLCGIANPTRFVASVKGMGVSVTSTTFYPDHHRYTEPQLAQCVSDANDAGAEAIVTTVKDMARMESLPNRFPLFSLVTTTEISVGRDKWEHHLKSLLR